MRKKQIIKRQSLPEVIKQQEKLHAKYKEYSLLSLEELQELYPILGGGYRDVCIFVAKEKARELLDKQNAETLEGDVQ